VNLIHPDGPSCESVTEYRRCMTIPESHVDILAKASFWHVATTGPDGEPQSSPVWVGTSGEGLIGFSHIRGRQKEKNLAADPRVALSAIDPENPYRYLEIRGVVERVDDDPSFDFINAMAKKYMGVDVYPASQPGDQRIVIWIRPEKSSSMG